MHNKVEMRLPREEQIPTERLKKNQQVKAILKEVRRSGGATGLPDLILSRADDSFMARLFEQEIPEIYDGIIEIRAIAREPGERAKVAVTSFDERVDPVGACVGMKGIRIHSIVRELGNENIDIIEFTDDARLFIARALSPAKVRDVQISEDGRQATVVVPDDQVSLAIGKQGQNVRLASKLTGYSLSLVKEGAEDIELVEFRDEIGRDIFEQLVRAGIETAREFLEADPTVLLGIIPKEKIVRIRTIMMEEFEEREDQSYLIALEEAAVALERGESTDGQSDDIAESYAEDTPEVYEQELADEGEAEEASTDGDEQVED
jgi:N utilization substance protein A